MASPTRPRPPHPPVSMGLLGSKMLWLRIKVTVLIPVMCHAVCGMHSAGSPDGLPASSWLLCSMQLPADLHVYGIVALQAVFQQTSCLPAAVHWRCQTAGCPLFPLLATLFQCCTVPSPLLPRPATFYTPDVACVHIAVAFCNCGCTLLTHKLCSCANPGHHHPEELQGGLPG